MRRRLELRVRAVVRQVAVVEHLQVRVHVQRDVLVHLVEERERGLVHRRVVLRQRHILEPARRDFVRVHLLNRGGFHLLAKRKARLAVVVDTARLVVYRTFVVEV